MAAARETPEFTPFVFSPVSLDRRKIPYPIYVPSLPWVLIDIIFQVLVNILRRFEVNGKHLRLDLCAQANPMILVTCHVRGAYSSKWRPMVGYRDDSQRKLEVI